MFLPTSVPKPRQKKLAFPADTFKDNLHQWLLSLKGDVGNEIDSVLVCANGSKGFIVTPLKLAHLISIKRRDVSHWEMSLIFETNLLIFLWVQKAS